METIKLPPYKKIPVYIKSSRDWTYRFYNIDKIHKAGFKGQGVKVGVMDTGVNWKHADLLDSYNDGSLHVLDSIGSDGFDRNGHGSWGVSRYKGRRFGAVPKCELFSMKCLSDEGGGNVENIVKGYHLLLDQKLHIITAALGFPKGTKYDDLFEDISKRAQSMGTLLFASAGNDGKQNDIDAPACLDGFISIGGFTSNLKRSVFSDIGSGLDIYAPGNGKGAYIGQHIAHLSGTSMSTSIAGANFALIRKYLIDTYGKVDYQIIKNIVSCQ